MNRKSEITKDAFRLILNNGISNVSINDIITYTNITKGCFYHYFSSKNELINEAFDIYVKGYYDNVLFEIKSSSFSPRKKLLSLVGSIMEYEEYLSDCYSDDGDSVSCFNFYSILIEGSKKFDYILDFRKNFIADINSIIITIVEEAKESGQIHKDIKAVNFAFKIIAINEGLTALKMINHSLDLKAIAVQNAVEMFDELLLFERT